MQTPSRVFDLLEYQLDHYPQMDAFAQKVGGEWKTFSTRESLDMVAGLAWGLYLAGVRKGDRIANITETNRPEWYFIDNAVMYLGAVHLPIYPNISSEEFEFILSDSEAQLAFVSSDRLYRLIAPLQARIPALRQIYSYDPVPGVPQWTILKDTGQGVLCDPDIRTALERIKDNVSPADL